METKVFINDLLWTVEIVEEGSEFLITDDGTEAYGLTDKEKLYIYLQKDGLPAQLHVKYIIHELTHAYLFSYGLDWNDLDEEQVAYFMQCHMISIFKDARVLAHTLFGIDDIL